MNNTFFNGLLDFLNSNLAAKSPNKYMGYLEDSQASKAYYIVFFLSGYRHRLAM